jgi:hypothetical protein
MKNLGKEQVLMLVNKEMEVQIPTSHCTASFSFHNLYLIQTMTTATKQKREKLSNFLQYKLKM